MTHVDARVELEQSGVDQTRNSLISDFILPPMKQTIVDNDDDPTTTAISANYRTQLNIPSKTDPREIELLAEISAQMVKPNVSQARQSNFRSEYNVEYRPEDTSTQQFNQSTDTAPENVDGESGFR